MPYEIGGIIFGGAYFRNFTVYFQFILLSVIQRFGVCLQINCLVTYAASSIFNSDSLFFMWESIVRDWGLMISH